MELKEAVQRRKKKPTFLREGYHMLKRLQKVKWRRPRGWTSKLRMNEKSHGINVTVGHGSQKEFRGLHKSGKAFLLIRSIGELRLADKNKQIIVIASAIGMRKKVEIIKEAQKLGLQIQNLDADKYLKQVEENLKAGKEAKKKRAERKKARESKKEPKKDKKAKADKEETKAEVKEEPKAEKVEVKAEEPKVEKQKKKKEELKSEEKK